MSIYKIFPEFDILDKPSGFECNCEVRIKHKDKYYLVIVRVEGNNKEEVIKRFVMECLIIKYLFKVNLEPYKVGFGNGVYFSQRLDENQESEEQRLKNLLTW